MVLCVWSVILYFTAAAFFFFQPSLAQAAKGKVVHHWLPTGLYTSVCIEKPKNDRTVTLLQTLYRALIPVIEDLQATNPDGTPKPSAAYTTFFKDAKNMPFVRDMFVRVIQGNSLLPSDQSLFSQGGSPVIWSLTQPGEFRSGLPPDEELVDRYESCLKEAVDGATAAWLYGSPYIFLCPLFWEATPPIIFGGIPPASANGVPAWNCLGLSRRGTEFNPSEPSHGAILIQYRMWILLEELLHYYVQLSTGKPAADNNPVNDVFKLSAFDSLYTVQTYMYYAASTSFHHLNPCRSHTNQKCHVRYLRRMQQVPNAE
ncbi:MAG: hypothetical protein LQ337_001920 [Flavoplaca oasis]|nr:MAG: hypothetical protein LQ337_001920 [Flavoplaca oasis]